MPVDEQLGVYYSKNWNHPVANEATPSWWKYHFIGNSGSVMSAEDYWKMFKDYVVAAKYYVRVGTDMNKAIQEIANYAFHPGSPQNKMQGTTPVSMLTLEEFVGVNHWENSLPPTVYQRLLPFFTYRIDNQVDTNNSMCSIAMQVIIGYGQSIGFTSGLLLSGLYVASQSSSQFFDIDVYSDLQGMHDLTKYVYVKGKIYSPGDYIAGRVEDRWHHKLQRGNL